ncbi:hypothetical protein B0I35DRAFT_436034 [Stachybotrys elegans]|uniref:Extracellular membrane protein CFEM domain-containing protein n=1 Tax=Stachybotrys elegans TaxID=80388 RepID=A0A8K0SSP6_9HYPO|nr:hypothetical protein B0I35DRAFT_436034 [Stachybotrys elegans]
MRPLTALCLLLTAVGRGAASDETLDLAPATSDIHLSKNFHGWVNPEDLHPMPQCIEQQNQTLWLDTLTKCTRKRCIWNIGAICFRHQWLTELSCLSSEFSPAVVREYLPYCGRSVLAKAQLYHWISHATGRMWLGEVGDSTGLDYLTSASLPQGYTHVNTASRAPWCLKGSSSFRSMESFGHVVGSCSFVSSTQVIGNAARPWEYRESQHSMVALASEVVGYDLTGSLIWPSSYFDIECLCHAFSTDWLEDPCLESEDLELTKEHLWLNATCESASLPDWWTDRLKVLDSRFISVREWKWPACLEDMPDKITELPNQCATDVCAVDSDGYCQVQRAVDRSCFCRNINFNSCSGSCHVFETRIDYVNWLHDLCGAVEDWHGLPNDWRSLAAPTVSDMIPWEWSLLPTNEAGQCASNTWKLGSIALVNLTTLLALLFGKRSGSIHRLSLDFLSSSPVESWPLLGIANAALQLLAYYLTAVGIQQVPGYEDIPTMQLALLWCTLPRLGWLSILAAVLQKPRVMSLSLALSCFLSETIMQCFASYYILVTFTYAQQHNLFFSSLDDTERGGSARLMYFGTYLWLLAIAWPFIQIVRAAYIMGTLDGSGESDSLDARRGHTTKRIAQELARQREESLAWLGQRIGHAWEDDKTPERAPLVAGKTQAKLYIAMLANMLCLWVAQCVFWAGFIGLSGDL